MLCPRCNQPNSFGASVCASCGAALPKAAQSKKLGGGRYTILRALKKGGMGALYLASQTIVGQERQVVVKEMLNYYDPGDPRGEERARRRFETEAATLAKLSIAGVPQVFDYFSDGGCYYIVMQYIDGQDLEAGLTHLDENDRVVKGAAYPAEKVRRWGIRVCKILEALAAKNVVHLDIKPANLILDSAGDIWLVDFGSAWSKFGPPAAGTPVTGQPLVLQKPSIYGTQGYAPREQIEGNPEPRSDVYALAATLYHLMTDQPPGDVPDPFPRLDRLPGDITQALKDALVQNVQQRVTAVQFGQRLERQVSSGPAFYWKDGSASHTFEDLVASANSRWQEALEYFRGDSWKKWLQDRHRYDLAARLQAIKAGQADDQLALDEFLRVLDPFLPAASLHLPNPTLDIGILPWGTKQERDIRIENRGSGCLQVHFAHLPAGITAQPAETTVHDSQVVKVSVDGGELTPRKKRQSLQLEANAGTAGQARLAIRLVVPEPAVKLDPAELSFSGLYPGQVTRAFLQVTNSGGSAFRGDVQADASWVRVEPAHFQCGPGESQALEVQVNMEGVAWGEHAAQVEIRAWAGAWQQTERVNLRAQVSALAAFWKYGAPALMWMALLAFYGWVFGMFLGALLSLLGGVAKGVAAIVSGVLVGCVIYTLPWAALGAIGALEYQGGADGAKRGAAVGCVLGCVAGLVAGLLLNWLALGLDYRSFDGAVGALTGAGLGLLFYGFSRGAGGSGSAD